MRDHFSKSALYVLAAATVVLCNFKTATAKSVERNVGTKTEKVSCTVIETPQQDKSRQIKYPFPSDTCPSGPTKATSKLVKGFEVEIYCNSKSSWFNHKRSLSISIRDALSGAKYFSGGDKAVVGEVIRKDGDAIAVDCN
jgi:hypothetical protein